MKTTAKNINARTAAQSHTHGKWLSGLIVTAAALSAAGIAQASEPSVVAHAVAVPAVKYPNPETELAKLADENAYIGKTRNYLQSIARYPATRETSLLQPQGQVSVWLEIERDGRLIDAGIARSSASMPLDSAALATVRRAQYLAWPADLFPGEARRRFTVTFAYGKGDAK